MNWRNIRVYNNSQNNAFEELVCQLARQEKGNGYKRFIRNGTPDGGVECFWQLENGKEYAWQAKYVFDIDSVIVQADKSYNTALKSCPDMCTFVVAVPFDLPDPKYEKDGKAVKSALEKWNDKVSFWEEKAKKENRNVTVVLWNASALVQKMMKPENEGMRYYWFNGEEFTTAWFSYVVDSMDTGVGYGDFGRYIFNNVLDKFEEDIDIDKVRRWVIKRTLQLGFDPKIHDVNLPGYFGRRGGATERIGKKYQWIALHEILARLQDRYKVRLGWKYENIADYFENAGEMGVRNFDPTLLLSKTFIDGFRQPERKWYCDYEYLDADYDMHKWLSEPISFEKNLIELTDLHKRKWMALCSYPSWNEYRDDEDEKASSKPEKIMDAVVHSIIVKKADIKNWDKWSNEYPQLTRYAIKSCDIGGMFYGENYWNVSYDQTDANADKEGWSELIFDGIKTGVFYANTSQRYRWEGEYDYSKEDTIGFDIPTKIIVDGLNLQDKKEIGGYYDKERCICFNPGIKQISNHLLLIDKEALTKWLEESGLCIIWTVSVEKRIHNGFHGIKGRAEWYGTYKLLRGEVKGKLKRVRETDFNIESDRFRIEFASERTREFSDQETSKLKQIMSEYMGDSFDSDEGEQFDL